MKNTLTLLIALLISLSSFAQIVNGFNYKAVIKDGSGNLVTGQTIDIRFTIYYTDPAQNDVYQEKHSPTTDDNGIIIVNMGEGNQLSGSFSGIDWNLGNYHLKTEIDLEQDNSYIDLGDTDFKAVPFARLAYKALGVEGLERVTDLATGWRLIGQIPSNYGPIGSNAIDMSLSFTPSNEYGATGLNSFAVGFRAKASGENAVAIGINTKAEALGSYAIGSNNIGGGTNDSWNLDETLFEIGNSINSSIPSNALTVLKNGTITAPSFDISEITDDKALVTKEFADANYNDIPFSGDYNDLNNQPIIILPTGLERITDVNPGWRLVDESDFFHGDLGFNAVDLSIVDGSIEEIGASGFKSFAAGSNTKAIGEYATAMGNSSIATGAESFAIGANTNAVGQNSAAMGKNSIATAEASTAIGKYNKTDNTGLFMVGNGTSTAAADRNNALIIYENGNSQFDGEIQHTSTGSANMIPIAYGTVESNGTIFSGTGNFTASESSGVFTIEVNGESLSASNSSCSIVPYSSTFRSSSVLHSAGKLNVYIYDISGNKAATTFQFIIYKL